LGGLGRCRDHGNCRFSFSHNPLKLIEVTDSQPWGNCYVLADKIRVRIKEADDPEAA